MFVFLFLQFSEKENIFIILQTKTLCCAVCGADNLDEKRYRPCIDTVTLPQCMQLFSVVCHQPNLLKNNNKMSTMLMLQLDKYVCIQPI